MPDWATMWTCKGALENGLSVAIAPFTRGSKTPGYKHCPRSTSGHQPGFSGVSSHVLHFVNWTIFWLVTKTLFANAAVWKFTCWTGTVLGLVWMNGAKFVVTAGFSEFFPNFFFFLTTLVYVGREVWTLQGDTDGQSGEGFLLSLHSFLPSTPPLHAKLLKMWWCFALPLEITDLH